MSDYVTGFQTASGIKKYDYNSLANLPESGSDATNTVISPNADYAEVGEWVDGNPDRENRLGYFIAIAEVGDNTIKIRKATSTDDIRGVSVYNPAFSGNASRDKYGEDGELLPQYNYIGLMGIVNIIDEGRCTVGGRCISNDDGIAVPSPNNMGYAVLERVDNRHILIAVEPGADMIQRVKTDIVAIEESIDDMKANQDYYSIGLDYALSGDGTYYIVTGPGTCKDVHLRIPSMYRGLPVKEIAYEAFSFCSALESVEISEGVTSISTWAFNDCTGLKRVVIPKSVSYIGELAFSNCRSLSQVIFDESSMLDTIESGVFQYCISLRSIEIPLGVSTIATGAFGAPSNLEKVVFPTSLIRIKADAFARSSSVIYVFYRGNSEDWDTISIEAPDDGNWGIANARMHYNYTDDFAIISEKLEQLSTGGGNVDLSAYQTKTDDSLETDDKSVVGGINEIKFDIEDLFGTSLDYEKKGNSQDDVVYSEGLLFDQDTNYGHYICAGIGDCTDTDIVIPPTYNGIPVREIGGNAFEYNTDITSIKVPNTVTHIGECAFIGCENATNIVVPDSVIFIGDGAFAECYSLESLTIPFAKSHDEIIDLWFWGELPESLKTIVIAGGEIIGEYAFADCTSLTSVVIGNSVTSIGEYAFQGCSSLEQIIIPRRVTKIGYGAFIFCDSLTIYCEAKRQPNGWDERWNYDNRPVVWGYGNETLETKAQTVIGAINELNEKVNEGGGSSKPSVSFIGTWTVIENPEIPTSDIPLEFTSNGYEFTKITTGTTGPDFWGIKNLKYSGDKAEIGVYVNNPSGSNGITHGWIDEVYRYLTVTKEPESREAIAWLGANTDAPKVELPKEEMPQIRFAGATAIGGWIFPAEKKVTFTVEITEGTVREGDILQICCKRMYHKKPDRRIWRLRAMENYSITNDDVGKRFLSIVVTFDQNSEKWLFRSDSNNLSNSLSSMYFRIKRVTKRDDEGQECDAIFSNIEKVNKKFNTGTKKLSIK